MAQQLELDHEQPTSHQTRLLNVARHHARLELNSVWLRATGPGKLERDHETTTLWKSTLNK